MTLNLIIIGFVLAMAYWWGRQGVFSALLHLLAVIVAGSIALAVWEPLTLTFLMGRMPGYAWGVGLLAPFVLVLIIVRTALDKLVGGNTHFSILVNWIAGSVLGALTGVLVTGLTVVGVGFLYLPSEMLGYEPYVVGNDGKVTDNPNGRGLLLPVDRWSAAFFTTLSGGAFSSGTPLSICQPELARQAAIYRVRLDENASITARPEAVAIERVGVFATPLKGVDDAVMKSLGDAARQSDSRIVIADTRWTATAGTFDEDSMLRLCPTSVWLLSVVPSATAAGDSEPRLEAPLGFSTLDPVTRARTFTPIRDARTFAAADQRGANFAWVFVLPAERVPRYLIVRHLRLDLPEEFQTDASVAVALLGQLPAGAVVTAPPAAVAGGPSVGAQSGVNPGAGAVKLEISAALPSIFSMNQASALEYAQQTVKAGHAVIPPLAGFASKEVRCESVFTFPTQTTVRVQIETQFAQETLGAARTAAASLGAVWLEDSTSTQYYPIGFAWLKSSNRNQEISIDRDKPIRSARELPVSKMEPGDLLYLYFALPHAVHISTIHIGPARQDANADVP